MMSQHESALILKQQSWLTSALQPVTANVSFWASATTKRRDFNKIFDNFPIFENSLFECISKLKRFGWLVGIKVRLRHWSLKCPFMKQFYTFPIVINCLVSAVDKLLKLDKRCKLQISISWFAGTLKAVFSVQHHSISSPMSMRVIVNDDRDC